MNILLTGGFGLLGKEILKLDDSLIAPSRDELDITDLALVLFVLNKYNPDTIIHLAASTNPPEHEEKPQKSIKTNVIGTANVAMACLEKSIRLVFTSSDYLYSGAGPHKEEEPLEAPNNFYLSKLAGECTVRICPNSLVLRLSFGPVTFPWEKVYEGQYNSKLYVDEIAPLVLAAAKSSVTGIMNIGGPRTSLEEYAGRTKKGIQTILKPDWVPKDTSLDLTKMQAELGIKDLKKLLKRY